MLIIIDPLVVNVTQLLMINLDQMPIHLGMHWCLATVDLRHMTINYYDRLARWLCQSIVGGKMYLKGAHILTCPPSSYLTLTQILKPHSMGGNNTECLAELDDYLHQEYLAKKGANSLFSIFGQKIDVQFCKYIQARVWMRRCLIEIWWEIFFISQTCFPNQYCSIIFRKISPWFFPFVKIF